MKTLSLSKSIAVSLGALIVLLAVVFTLKAQTPALNLKGGSKLVYSMQGAETHDVTVIVNTMTPTISYKWRKSETEYGKVIVNQAAFSTGRKVSVKLFNDETGDFAFFWISKGMLSELALGKTSFNLSGIDKMIGVAKTGVEQMQIKVNGIMKSVEVLHAKSVTPGGTEEFYVLNDANNPLILKIKSSEGGFELKEITE